jgi:hypothetical protein
LASLGNGDENATVHENGAKRARSGSDYGTARRRDCGRGALYSGHNMAKWCKFARARGIACGGWSTLTSSCGEADASRPAWQGMTAGSQEEGEYGWEYISNHQGSTENGKEETHAEPAVLYTPLAEGATSDGSSDDEPEGGFRILIKGGPGGHGCAKRKTCHHHGGGGGGGGGGGIIEKCAHGAAKGAVTGAAGGAAAGAVGGEGAGAGPGAVAGAVGGAVAGCLSEVIP